MGMFTVIPKDTFDSLQMDAGVLLSTFDPENVTAPSDEDIICATTGGIKIDVTPTFSDMGEDVDNCPVNMMELKHLDSWEIKIGTTGLGTSPEAIKFGLGVADISGDKITLRRSLKKEDFQNLWWVGDKANGGVLAAKLSNVLSTGGFSLQTGKNAKGQTSIELTAHVSIDKQDEMPIEFYSLDPVGA